MATGATHRSRAVAGVTGYVVLVGAALAALVASDADTAALAVLAVVAVVVLVVLLRRVLGGTATALGRITADTALIADANPTHRLDPAGAGDLEALARAVNRLADERESALRGAEEQAEAARRDVESERNRLAALMAQLTVAVVVCNGEGRILLYNEAARSLVDDGTLVGLGRSVFTVVDRGLVAHALDRLSTGAESVYGATTLHGDQLLRVRVTLVGETATGVPDAAGERPEGGAGFVLVLEDLTRQARAGEERERVLRGLTEATRASLGSIRAAVESVLDFPDLTSDERERFLGIVRDEADGLGSRVDALAVESFQLADDRVLTEIAADDLLGVLRRELERAGVVCSASPATETLWLRADGHAVARALAHVFSRLREEGHGLGDVALVCASADGHARVDVRWAGSPPPAATVDALLGEPLPGGGTTTVRGVADRHGAEVWCGRVDDATAYLRMLLPTAVGAEEPPSPRTSQVTVGSRPEFYDFDLFTVGSRPAEIVDHRLDEMSFTVFDTETTGLDPTGGDRIIAVGAVRVVNGRVLRQETFEQLVQPQRSVPAESTAIHGITAEMLDGQPTIDEVLPAFVRFAEETVLVGHNVSFDLQFLQLSAASAGVVIAQPALDTLLLHAALHPDHREHTLEAIAARLGVSVVGRHTALGDALVTAEVFVALTSLLRSQGIHTLGDALTASRKTYQARVDERLYRS